MINLHPPLTGFPGVLVALLLVNEFVCRGDERIKRFLLICAALFIPCTYLSGYVGVEFAEGIDPAVIKAHQGYAKFVLVLLVPLIVCGLLPRVRTAYLVLLPIVFGVVLYTSLLGGNLVFGHGAGVKARPAAEP